jgi:hypothetical protein
MQILLKIDDPTLHLQSSKYKHLSLQKFLLILRMGRRGGNRVCSSSPYGNISTDLNRVAVAALDVAAEALTGDNVRGRTRRRSTDTMRNMSSTTTN